MREGVIVAGEDTLQVRSHLGPAQHQGAQASRAEGDWARAMRCKFVHWCARVLRRHAGMLVGMEPASDAASVAHEDVPYAL